ncbi:glycine-rich domain-containing protein [Rivihabitans pingtungensis]|uniref:Glycine-rich domain-containing protein n=1 Tax=Rivihabitans pingtungensis TaxID=1054498 RepID=A0A318KTY1_9NEIS|nr:hypothetical protein [Rivihabitans pingtungensis]PXX79146.1 hypothetical protein DFR34_10836 [Rivihabitans pingtungensis]
MITLKTTAAGRALINAALAVAAPAPVLSRMVLGAGVVPDPATASAASIAAAQIGQAVQLAIAKHDADIISGSAGFPAPTAADVVNWVALLYADGTPAAIGEIIGGMPRIPGMLVEMPWAWASTDTGELGLDISIIDLNALMQQVADGAYASLDVRSGGIVNTYLTPFATALGAVLEHGAPRVLVEGWTDQFRLRRDNAVRVVGVVAGDDSLDLSEHADTLQDGDYVLFSSEHSELVRLRSNLELGRRRLVGDIQHTYPTATLSRTNWLIAAGQATAQAGQTYHSDTVRLHRDANKIRVIIRATTTAAPAVSLRWGEHIDPTLSVSDYTDAVLDRALPVPGRPGLLDYVYTAQPNGEFAALRVLATASLTCESISLHADWGAGSVMPAPQVQGAEAVPGRTTHFGITGQTRLMGGKIAEFAVSIDGKTHKLPAINDRAELALTLDGELGAQYTMQVLAWDDLGNNSSSTYHKITLVDAITHPAPTIISPQPGAGGVSAMPTLSIVPAVVPCAVHVRTDWVLRDVAGEIVWALASEDSLQSVSVPADTLSYGAQYTVRVQLDYSDGWHSAVASASFTTMAAPVLKFVAPVAPAWASESVNIALNQFAIPETTHASTDWELLDTAGAPVWQRLADSTHLLSITLPAQTMQPMHNYTLRARQHGASGQSTHWITQPLACAAVWEFTAPGISSWTPPVDGDYEIVVVGAGGAGSTVDGRNYGPGGNGGGSGYAARAIAQLGAAHGPIAYIVGRGGSASTQIGTWNGESYAANPGGPGESTALGGIISALGGLPGTALSGGDGASGGGGGGGTGADAAGAGYHGEAGTLGGSNGSDGVKRDNVSSHVGRGAGPGYYSLIDPAVVHAQASSDNTAGTREYSGGSQGGGGGGGGGGGFGQQSYGAGGAGGSKNPAGNRYGMPGRAGYIRIKLLQENAQ